VFEGGAQVRRIVALAREEASRFGHRYLGPEHLPLGMLREGASEAARLLEAHGVGLAAARGQLLALAELAVVPTARPSDRALLGTLGVDLEEIRRTPSRPSAPPLLPAVRPRCGLGADATAASQFGRDGDR
jgi:hypothetical protein